VSTGSACTTGSAEVSHVLTAMGYPEEEAGGALRVTVGRATTGADLDAAVEAIPRAIERLRAGGRDLAAADPVAGAGAP
jgi:cysteine desulfurase